MEIITSLLKETVWRSSTAYLKRQYGDHQQLIYRDGIEIINSLFKETVWGSSTASLKRQYGAHQ
jgi:hypothetical protein